MEEQKQINLEHLYRLAKSGKSAREIMQELDLTNTAMLQNALTNLMEERNESIDIPGLVGKASINPHYSDDGIRISPDMLYGTNFMAGDQFRLVVSGEKIILEKVN